MILDAHARDILSDHRMFLINPSRDRRFPIRVVECLCAHIGKDGPLSRSQSVVRKAEVGNSIADGFTHPRGEEKTDKHAIIISRWCRVAAAISPTTSMTRVAIANERRNRPDPD